MFIMTYHTTMLQFVIASMESFSGEYVLITRNCLFIVGCRSSNRSRSTNKYTPRQFWIASHLIFLWWSQTSGRSTIGTWCQFQRSEWWGLYPHDGSRSRRTSWSSWITPQPWRSWVYSRYCLLFFVCINAWYMEVICFLKVKNQSLVSSNLFLINVWFS